MTSHHTKKLLARSFISFITGLLLGASIPAGAALVSHSFSGELTGSQSGYGFPGDFAIGNPFTVTVSYDNSVSDINGDPNIGLYLLGPGSTLTATVIDSLNVVHTFTADASTISSLIFDDYLGINRLDFSGGTEADPSTGYRVNLYLSDPLNQVIFSDLLSLIDLGGAWGLSVFEITSPQGIGGGGIYSFFTPAAAVPEPATLALLGIALAGLGFSRRKAGA